MAGLLSGSARLCLRQGQRARTDDRSENPPCCRDCMRLLDEPPAMGFHSEIRCALIKRAGGSYPHRRGHSTGTEGTSNGPQGSKRGAQRSVERSIEWSSHLSLCLLFLTIWATGSQNHKACCISCCRYSGAGRALYRRLVQCLATPLSSTFKLGC